jgi:PAS domain S-box-containing protein
MFMLKKIETGNLKGSRPYLRDIVLFTLLVSLSFWLLDSLTLWTTFNDKYNSTLLELALTKIPAENIYIRGMFFLMACFFGLFLAKYVGRYEEKYHMLLLSVDRFERLTDNAKDMIFHMSLPEGKYEFVNKATSHIFGYAPEEFYKDPMFIEELIHPSSLAAFRSQWRKLLAGTITSPYEYKIIRKDGAVRWMNQRNTLYFDDAGVPNALEGIVTDVTELKAQEPQDNN